MSSLVKNVGTIGGLTAVSRVFGFARDMLLARVLGAGLAADAWQLAFTLPNTFRRLFAEGAFSVAFVPMYTRELHGEGGGDEAADRFAGDVLSVFVWVLLGFSAIAMLAMPGLVWLLAREYQDVPGKFELTVTLSRIAFPYLGFVSLVSMLAGVLNARSRFAPGAFVPVLLNVVYIGGIIAGSSWRRAGGDDISVTYWIATSIFLAGATQLAYMAWATHKAKVRLRITFPRVTPQVKRLCMLMLPATFGAGVYQISQLVDTFFATSLPQGSLTLLKYADRLNQMPLGIFGIALGTAILPALARFIQAGDNREAQRLQSNAVEVGTLLTLPAAAALAICAPAFTNGFFLQGKMTSADTAIMAQIVAALVAGLPAYVLVKVFQPAFFSREDTRTPVYVAAGVLAINIALNFYVVPRYGIVGLAGATAFTATLNVVTLYTILQVRGWFHFTGKLAGRIARQIVATAAMSALLWWLTPQLADHFAGNVFERVWSLSLLVGAGATVFFAIAWAIGAIDKDLIAQLRRKRPAEPVNLSE
jgi:putative peptidoglycan lipid II flippase